MCAVSLSAISRPAIFVVLHSSVMADVESSIEEVVEASIGDDLAKEEGSRSLFRPAELPTSGSGSTFPGQRGAKPAFCRFTDP